MEGNSPGIYSAGISLKKDGAFKCPPDSLPSHDR